MASQPQIIIIAGPNGAGKTTFARELYLPLVDSYAIYDNSGSTATLIEWK